MVRRIVIIKTNTAEGSRRTMDASSLWYRFRLASMGGDDDDDWVMQSNLLSPFRVVALIQVPFHTDFNTIVQGTAARRDKLYTSLVGSSSPRPKIVGRPDARPWLVSGMVMVPSRSHRRSGQGGSMTKLRGIEKKIREK
jgi:hypothetical protein